MATAKATECAVCCEKLNKSNRKPVDCAKCGFEACRDCHRHYLLETALDPHCMNCKKDWDIGFLAGNFTQAFIGKDLKAHREQVLFDRERALLPETQADAEIYRRKVKAVAMILGLRNKLKVHMEQRPAYTSDMVVRHAVSVEEAMADLDINRKHALDWGIMKMEMEYHKDCVAVFEKALDGRVRSTRQPSLFVRACPAEGCRGFLSTAWKCGLCGIKVCASCHEIKKAAGGEGEGEGEGEGSAAHECDPDMVASAQLIAKDSKPCPNCACLIFRVSGCSQMFCTSCHTPFDWKTGEKITGFIHNPELTDLAARLGKTPADLIRGGVQGAAAPAGDAGACGARMPDIWDILPVMRRLGMAQGAVHSVSEFVRCYAHNRDIVVPRFQVPAVGDTAINKDLRIKYLVGELNEAQFKRRLQQREKANNKKREVGGIINTYMAVIGDLIRQMAGATTGEEILAKRDEAHQVREMINEMLKTACEKYKASVWHVQADWHIRVI